jgi:hypothetical protein
MIYASALAKEPGGRLNQDDVKREAAALGASTSSPEVFIAAIREQISGANQSYTHRVSGLTGGTPGQTLTPIGTLTPSRPSQDVPLSGAVPGAAAPLEGAAPTGPAKPVTLAPQKTEALTPEQQAQEARTKVTQKESDEATKRSEEAQIRQFNIQQAPVDAKLKLDAANRDIQRLEMAKEAAQEARDWKAYQKLKDQQAQAQKQADKIAAAFAQFARAMQRTGSVSVGGSAPAGAEQDASAFKIGERPQRRAPTPAPAVSGQTYRARRRSREE